jgi:predicted LPLAT superfamily acyltransferase
VSGSATTWLSTRERGSLFGIRLAFGLATLLGRRPMRLLVHLIALWYRLFDRNAVAASRTWLARVHGRPPGFWEVYRHIRVFVQVTLDRVFLLKGRTAGLVFTRTGGEHMQRQKATGRGAILLGAHLGSYEAMRAGGASVQIPIQILGYFENARMINALFERLNPAMAARVIHVGDDPVSVMSRVRARIEAGDFVGLLGDRVGLNDRVIRARFFGQEAAFAAGPFLVACLLRCPVYLVFGLYREPNRYDLHCEPFAERIELPRADRQRALQAWVDRYAGRLEAYACQAPDNWFNWFDFWGSR